MSTKTRQKFVNYGGGTDAGARVLTLIFSFVLLTVCDNVYFHKHFTLSVYYLLEVIYLIIDNDY